MNPIEQIWKQIRSMGFKNEVFRTLKDVIDRLYDTINLLTKDMVKSITHRSEPDFIIFKSAQSPCKTVIFYLYR